MDWSNEHYVRVYTRDTTTWKRLRWSGQSVFVALLRKLDAAGVLDIDDMQPWEAVALHCGAPDDVAREGAAACLALGVIVHDGHRLVCPNYLDAQWASKSDKQRQRESRETRRVTKRDEVSQNVTECHAPSHAVTGGHAESHAVTLPPLTTPPKASPAAHAPVREAPPFDMDDIVATFSRLRVEAKLGRYRRQHTDYARLEAAVEWAREERPGDPAAVVSESIRNYLRGADDGLKGKGYPFWGWAADPGAWLAWKPVKPKHDPRLDGPTYEPYPL